MAGVVFWQQACLMSTHGSVVARALLRSGSTISLFMALFLTASYNLAFAQEMLSLSLCSQCLLFPSVLMLSWIQTKEPFCTVHTVVFQRCQR